MKDEAYTDPNALLALQENLPPFRCDMLSVTSVPVSSSTLSIIPGSTGSPSLNH